MHIIDAKIGMILHVSVRYLMLHNKLQWIFKNDNLSSLMISASEKCAQNEQGPRITPL